MAERRSGSWINHGTLRTVYSSWWVTLRIDDVEKPDGSHTEHEVILGPASAGMVVIHPERGVLMIWRHRFMPDSWGWEIPGGKIDDGETPETSARRECVEETGWQAVGDVRHLSTHHPSVGLVSQTFHLFLAEDAEAVAGEIDANEAAQVAWRPIEQVIDDISSGAISDAFTLVGLLLGLGVTGHGAHLALARANRADEDTVGVTPRP